MLFRGNSCEWWLGYFDLPLAWCCVWLWGVGASRVLCCRCGGAAEGCGIFWWTWDPVRMKTVFLVVSYLTFLVPLPSSLKLRRWREALAATWLSSMCCFCAMHFLRSLFPPPNCVAVGHCSCFTVVSNSWFRKVRDICGFPSPTEVVPSDWCVLVRTVALVELLNWGRSGQPCLCPGTHGQLDLRERVTCCVAIGYI